MHQKLDSNKEESEVQSRETVAAAAATEEESIARPLKSMYALQGREGGREVDCAIHQPLTFFFVSISFFPY